jgi:FG-GAP repeat protein
MSSPTVDLALVHASGERPIETEIAVVNGDGVPDVLVTYLFSAVVSVHHLSIERKWIESVFWLSWATRRLYSGGLSPFGGIEIEDVEKGIIIVLQITLRRLALAFIALSVLGALPASGQVIREGFKLLPTDGTADDLFGLSIAINDGVVAVGALGDDFGERSGSAYLFDASTSALITKLLPSDGAASDFFGFSIAVANGVVAVGALLDDDNGVNSGSAYLFDLSTGALIAKLLASDGAVEDRFGNSIAIDNGVVAVGARRDDDNGLDSGSAYLFDASTGAKIAKLLPSDGAANDDFGSSIAIDNGIVAVVASGDDDNGANSGSVYLFSATTGEQIAKLLPSDGAANDNFGSSIAIDNGVVAVGAWTDDDNGINSGSAYLFNASTGALIVKLLASDGAVEDRFGNSIAIDNGVVAVGAIGDNDNGTDSGSAYLFDVSTGGQIAKLLPCDGAARDQFGVSIAIDNGVAAVGSRQDDDNGTNSGSAYLFGTVGASCAADLNGDCVLDFFDVSIFLGAFSLNDPIADFTGDAIFDFFDVMAFLQAFSDGCP